MATCRRAGLLENVAPEILVLCAYDEQPMPVDYDTARTGAAIAGAAGRRAVAVDASRWIANSSTRCCCAVRRRPGREC